MFNWIPPSDQAKPDTLAVYCYQGVAARLPGKTREILFLCIE